MKKFIFNLLLFPLLFCKRLKKVSVKLFFTFFLSSLLIPLSLQAADVASPTCPGTNYDVPVGISTITETTAGNGDNLHQLTIPHEGNITISFIYVKNNADASLTVGKNTGCKITPYLYDVSVPSAITYTFSRFEVATGDIIDINVYDIGNNDNYTITINYEVPIPDSITIEKPTFCYNYYYEQNDQNLSNNDGNISTDSPGTDQSDIHINLSIKLLDINSLDNNYSTAQNIVVDIINIDEAHYIRESVFLRKPGTFYSIQIPDSDLDVSNTYINDIEIGTMRESDIFFIDYEIQPQDHPIEFPLNAIITYDLPIPVGDTFVPVSRQSILPNDIGMCPEPGSGYSPAYSIFNVEDNYLNRDGPIYNLHTQTARRVDDLEIVSYEVNNPHIKNPVAAFISVELINVDNAGPYPSACSNPTSALTPRIWLPFIGQGVDLNTTQIPFNKVILDEAIAAGQGSDNILGISGDVMTHAEDFYNVVNKNTAFRISYSTLGDDFLHTLESSDCQAQQVAPCYIWGRKSFTEIGKLDVGKGEGVCAQDMAQGEDRIPQWCGNNGEKGLDAIHLAECMECIYGSNIQYLCSRDNFAIRPESFRMNLKDQVQPTSATLQSDIAINDSTATRHQIVAGYNYSFEVNATNHENDAATPGYNQSFIQNGSDGNLTFRLKQSFSIDLANCNDITDHNKTLTLYNGEIITSDTLHVKRIDLNSTQVGEYDLTITDQLWTSVDWDNTLMTHHVGYFNSGDDCIFGSSIVPNIATTNAQSGCSITSDNHTNNDTSAQYTNIPLRVHPYKFDLNSSILGNPVTPMVGPNIGRDQTFVYIDTPPTMDQNDTNMSYNMNGTFVATGYDGNVTSNYVTGCYADDVNMTLKFIYNYDDVPPTTPFLTYSLKDYNTTNGSVRPASSSDDFEVRDHNSTTLPFIIDQNATYFSKDMMGAVRMNLGYNFRRTYNQALNPRYIEFKDFNITHASTLMSPSNIYADLTNDHKIFGDRVLDQNVSFFYGRAKPSKFFYEDITASSVNTPVAILIYCGDVMSITDCNDRVVQTAYAQTNEANWWLSLDHTTNESDGDIVLVRGDIIEGNTSATADATVTPASPNTLTITNNTAIDTDVIVSRSNSAILPMTVLIDLDTNSAPPLLSNRWLIYNESNNSVPSPFYKVRFIGEASWTGEGQTGHVVDVNASYKKSQRVDW